MSKELKITKGEWRKTTNLSIDNKEITIVNKEGASLKCIAKIERLGFGLEWLKECESNAKLIVDAGTTANKCGLLPSELLEQRDSLLKAILKIQELADVEDEPNEDEFLEADIELNRIIGRIQSKQL